MFTDFDEIVGFGSLSREAPTLLCPQGVFDEHGVVLSALLVFSLVAILECTYSLVWKMDWPAANLFEIAATIIRTVETPRLQ